MSRRALIIGVGGQDGSLLAAWLLENDYSVVGVVRRAPDEYPNLRDLKDSLELVTADLLDRPSVEETLRRTRPQEVYNLAAPSFVPRSWDEPVLTAEFAAVGVTSLLEAVRAVDDGIRVYQASSSEIFGEPREVPQTEDTPLAPVTPYGVAKAYGHFIARSYRHRYGLHLSSGILYNHESPRRPVEFLPRKVSRAAARIALGLEESLIVGDLGARRDWGYAGDYVKAMWLMLQQDEPGDYVVASGETHTVEELISLAFERVGLDWREHVRVDSSFVRGKAELHDLVGDASKARRQLGWRPSLDFADLVALLVDADVELARAEARGRAARVASPSPPT